MPEMIILEAQEHMEKTIDALHHELSKVRTGRANPKMFDDVQVEYYGAPTPINQVGNISVPEASQLLIKPYDRNLVGEIEKALLAANLGVTPQNEGTQIRIVLPALTSEKRRDLVKAVHKHGEEYKVHVRNVRRHANDSLKKLENNHDISEDDLKGYLDEVQELTDEFIKKIDSVIKEKETEITQL
jgi:ribosome recycling factor